MDRSFVELSDTQWEQIRAHIARVAGSQRDAGEGPVNDVSLSFMWMPAGRIVELNVGGATLEIEAI